MPVFIVGSGRSGTSILALVVCTHPKFGKAPFEPQIISCPNAKAGLFLLDIAKANKDMRGIGSMRAHLQSRFRIERPEGIRGFCQLMPRESYMAAVDRVCDLTGSVRSFTDEVMGYVLRKRDAACWVDDGPVNGRLIPFILRHYPDAKFIHAIRDGRDVAKGMVRKGWHGRSYELAIQAWAAGTSTTRAFGRAFAPEQYIEVRHDHLLRDTTREIDRIFSFLGAFPPEAAASLIRQDRADQFKSAHTSEETELLRILAPELASEFIDHP